MSTIRMAPPSSGNKTITYCGRTYTGVAGTPVDVPVGDATVLEANGWCRTGNAGTGATAARPTSPNKCDTFADTTLNVMVIWDGAAWRNEVTHATA